MGRIDITGEYGVESITAFTTATTGNNLEISDTIPTGLNNIEDDVYIISDCYKMDNDFYPEMLISDDEIRFKKEEWEAHSRFKQSNPIVRKGFAFQQRARDKLPRKFKNH